MYSTVKYWIVLYYFSVLQCTSIELYNVVLIFHPLSTLSYFSCFNFLAFSLLYSYLINSDYKGSSKRLTPTPPGFFNLHILGRKF